jgi:hypothetical protein
MPFKYDIAVSFLGQDESLARELHNLLAPLKVFVYSKAQGEVAGRDGVEAFRGVFRDSACISLVLFRAGWGKTPWTRVEEAAIRDHCLEVGWDHLMFVRLDKSGKPTWVPDTLIYFDLELYGVDGLVGVTKAQCARLGVEIRAPTAVDLARRLAAEEALKRETEHLIRNSPQPLRDAAAALVEQLERRLAEIEHDAGWPTWRGSTADEFVAAFRDDGPSIHLRTEWRRIDREAVIVFRLYSGRLLTPQERARGGFTMEEPTEVRQRELKLSRATGLGWCWQEGNRIMATEAAAEFIVEMFVTERGRQAG